MWEFCAQKNDRLDRLLREQNISPWMSRQAWEKAVDEGRVRVAGKIVRKSGEQVSAGAELTLDLPTQLGLLPSTLAARLVWASPDQALAVFYKDAGIATYPLYPWENGTLANAIAAYAESKGLPFASLSAPPVLEGGLLQRLDRHTSGLVTTAFSAEAKAFYRKKFSGEVNKNYLAIVTGEVNGVHRLYFLPSSAAKVTARREAKAGDVAVELEVKVLAASSRHSLLEVRTTHGLRHVVRAGLAALGAPLVGDTTYGGSTEAPFHQLHAQSLQIPGFSEISAPVPQSFVDCLMALGLHYSP